MKSLLAIALLFSTQAFAMSKASVEIDPVTQSTLLDGDITSMVEGCGNQPFVGGTFCRQTEGDAAGTSLWLIGPPAKCTKSEGCVYFKIYNNKGSLVFGGVLPPKSTRLEVPWKALLQRDTFEMGDRGFWVLRTEVYWLDEKGFEHEAVSQADIVLRVTRKEYVPLNMVEFDPNFVWEWCENGYQYKVTSGLRAFIKKVPTCILN